MKTVQIEDDLYTYLLKNIKFIGEDASSILRRLLGLGATANKGSEGHTGLEHKPKVLEECIESHFFKKERDAVGRFLAALSWLSQKHPSDFEKVLDIRGRIRLYFARSPDELQESGNSVMPQRIPNSPYYVVTNNDTPKKKRILNDVLRVLGYSSLDRNQLCDALGD